MERNIHELMNKVTILLKRKMFLFNNWKEYFLFIFLICCLLSCKQNIPENLHLQNLRCEMLSNPEGIDIIQPRLSWEISGNQRNIQQEAYQVLVASSIEKLKTDSVDLWNSGKIKSNQSIHVKYNGLPLKSNMKCYWKVKVWANNGKSNLT